MDSQRIIWGSIIILICIAPIIYLKIKSVLRKRKITTLLNRVAQINNTTLSLSETWNNSGIGLSKNGSQLFFVSADKHSEKRKTIALSAFHKCKVINDNAGVPYTEGNFKVTNAIELELTGANDSIEHISFYNIGRDGNLLTDELKLAKKWCRLVEECITRQTKLQTALE